ncbi:MAG: MEDS domain-containing protein, partial [Candidatus Rokuibacteriota bacterium]
MSDATESTPGGSPTWEEILRAPVPTQHVAQFHAQTDFLVRAIGRYAEEGLRRGEGVVLIARATHGRAISHRLAAEGLALDDLMARRQLRILDADRTLPQVLVHGVPAPGRFQAVVGRAVASTKAAGYPTVRAFGEMADLLRRTSEAAALRLEALWNALLVEERIALVCGYSVDAFDPGIYD